MTEAFRKELTDLTITSSNIEEIRDLRAEFDEMISLFEFENQYGYEIINEILYNYKTDNKISEISESIDLKLRILDMNEGDLDENGYYLSAKLEYKCRQDRCGVNIKYKRILKGDKAEEDGPHFSPTEHEAPELYDDFLRWFVYQDFSEYFEI